MSIIVTTSGSNCLDNLKVKHTAGDTLDLVTGGFMKNGGFLNQAGALTTAPSNNGDAPSVNTFEDPYAPDNVPNMRFKILKAIYAACPTPPDGTNDFSPLADESKWNAWVDLSSSIALKASISGNADRGTAINAGADGPTLDAAVIAALAEVNLKGSTCLSTGVSTTLNIVQPTIVLTSVIELD